MAEGLEVSPQWGYTWPNWACSNNAPFYTYRRRLLIGGDESSEPLPSPRSQVCAPPSGVPFSFLMHYFYYFCYRSPVWPSSLSQDTGHWKSQQVCNLHQQQLDVKSFICAMKSLYHPYSVQPLDWRLCGSKFPDRSTFSTEPLSRLRTWWEHQPLWSGWNAAASEPNYNLSWASFLFHLGVWFNRVGLSCENFWNC